MIALAAASLSLLLVPLIGGRLVNLGRVRLRHGGAVLALFLVQGALRGRLPGLEESTVWAMAAWGAVCVSLVFLLWPSRNVVGVPILMIGLAANLWVTLLNQGMPYVTLSGAAATEVGSFYHLANRASTFAWMGDVLPDPTMGWLLSLGDMLLFVGFVVTVLHATSTDVVAAHAVHSALPQVVD